MTAKRYKIPIRISGAVLWGMASAVVAQENLRLPERVSFNEHIRPILSTACFACHGPDASKAKGGLQLHRKSTALAWLDDQKTRRAIEPGRPDRSVMIGKIHAVDEEDRMPPSDSGKSLSLREKKLLERWIAQGATWEDQWSLVPPRRSAPPEVRDLRWVRNDYDRFVLARLEERGLGPAKAATKAEWLRRVTLDLTGLPPTLEEREGFLKDSAPDAWSRVVDRLLASDACAETLTLKWLDNARFADSNGYQYDGPNNQWPWRNWVIGAFKANMPFDRFVTEQLAGDLLPEATLDQKIATAFNRNHGFTIEGGVTPEEYRVQYVNDRVETFGTVFLGLTMGCARCHDHKFDDVSSEEFYALSSFFDNIPGSGYWGGGLNTVATPVVRFPTADPKQVAMRKAELSRLEAHVAELVGKEIPEYRDWKTSIFDADREGRITAVRTSDDGVPATRLDDGTWRIGKDGVPDQLIVRVEMETRATDLRSVVLQPRLDRGSLGWSPRGEAILSCVEVRVQSVADLSVGRDVILDSANGRDFRKKQPVKHALDSSGGWWLPRSASPEDSIAVFSSREQFGYAGGSRLTVTLRFEGKAKKHSLRRFGLRLSAQHGAGRNPSHFVFDPGHGNPKKFFVERHFKDFRQRLQNARSAYISEKNRSVPVMVMSENAKRRRTRVLVRGDYTNPGKDVSPAVPRMLGGWREEYPKNRLGLAWWLTSPENPLLARVTVNRFWQMLFGAGLVKTTEDFGRQGESPTHPKLLDHLALDLIESGWDVRAVLAKIVLSATYRQSSNERTDTGDADNRWLSRGPRFRLSAEAIRDQALFVSGLLVNKLGGPSVMVYQPDGLWLDLGDRRGFTRPHIVGNQDDVHRRSVYVYAKRAMPNPVLSTFDTPSRDVCVVKRQNTNTPLQALVLRHETGYVESARVFAERLMSLEKSFVFQMERAWLMLLTRRPEAAEIAAMANLRADRIAYFREHPAIKDKLISIGKQPRNEKLDGVELAALTEVCRVLFNLSETVTRR